MHVQEQAFDRTQLPRKFLAGVPESFPLHQPIEEWENCQFQSRSRPWEPASADVSLRTRTGRQV